MRTAPTAVLVAVCVLLAAAAAPGQSRGAGTADQTAAAPQVAAPPMPASPVGTAATQVGGSWITPPTGGSPRYRDGKWIVVEYGRPILRGRPDVFGKGADYGKAVVGGAPLWRAGANQTTRLRTEAALVVGGKTLAPGEYSLFVDLKEHAWTLVISTQGFQRKWDPANKTETWGAFNYDTKFDVVRVPMQLGPSVPTIEQFTIAFLNMTQQGGTLAMMWDKTIASVGFRLVQ